MMLNHWHVSAWASRAQEIGWRVASIHGRARVPCEAEAFGRLENLK
jgi:hypothetical protein